MGHPVDGEWRGFFPRTQLFGPTAAVQRYSCLSRVLASLTCGALKVSRIGYYDDFGVISPECLIEPALDVFASSLKAFVIIPQENKSELKEPVEKSEDFDLAHFFEDGTKF